MTRSDAFTLERLLAPVPPTAFLEEYWEQRPLVLQRADPDYYRGLLTAADVDRMVTTSDMTFPEFRLADADHIVRWVEGGATSLTNGRLLCQAHNRGRAS